MLEVLSRYWWFALLALVLVVGSGVFRSVTMKKFNQNNADYERQHPDAAKVYLDAKTGLVQEYIELTSVNGTAPMMIQEQGKLGFYAKPGQNHVVLKFTRSRPGVVFKYVGKTTGEVEELLDCQAGQSYLLRCDNQTGEFSLAPLETLPDAAT